MLAERNLGIETSLPPNVVDLTYAVADKYLSEHPGFSGANYMILLKDMRHCRWYVEVNSFSPTSASLTSAYINYERFIISRSDVRGKIGIGSYSGIRSVGRLTSDWYDNLPILGFPFNRDLFTHHVLAKGLVVVNSIDDNGKQIETSYYQGETQYTEGEFEALLPTNALEAHKRSQCFRY